MLVKTRHDRQDKTPVTPVVPVHHTFGQSGGTRGVHDGVHVLGPHFLHWAVRRGGEQFVEIHGSSRKGDGFFVVVTQDDNAFKLREIVSNLIEHRHIALAEDDRFGVGVVDDVAEPLAPQRNIERYGDATQLGIAPPRIEKLRHIGQHHANFVVFLNAHAFKGIADAIDALVKLVVGDALVFRDHRHFTGIHRGFVLEDGAVALPRIIHRVPYCGNFG